MCGFYKLVSASAPFIQLLICKFDLKRHTHLTAYTKVLGFRQTGKELCSIVSVFFLLSFHLTNEWTRLCKRHIICLFLACHSCLSDVYLLKSALCFRCISIPVLRSLGSVYVAKKITNFLFGCSKSMNINKPLHAYQ